MSQNTFIDGEQRTPLHTSTRTSKVTRPLLTTTRSNRAPIDDLLVSEREYTTTLMALLLVTQVWFCSDKM